MSSNYNNRKTKKTTKVDDSSAASSPTKEKVARTERVERASKWDHKRKGGSSKPGASTRASTPNWQTERVERTSKWDHKRQGGRSKPGAATRTSTPNTQKNALIRGNQAPCPTQKQLQQANEWNEKGLQMREPPREVECYENAMQLDPSSTAYIVNKGITLRQVGCLEESILCFDKAIALDGNDKEAHMEKGVSLNNLGRYDEAISCYEQVIALPGSYKEAYKEKGTSLQNLRRYGEATLCYDQAIALDSNYKPAYKEKGISLRRVGLYEEALPCFDRTMALDGNDKDAYHERGRYDQAIALNDNDKYAYRGKSVSLWWLGRYEEASKYERASNGDGDALHELQIQCRESRLSECRSQIVKAIEHIHVAQVYGVLRRYVRKRYRSTESVSNFIIKQILSARCPYCESFISEREWPRENALRCIGCAQHFCTWCFEAALSEVDAEYCASKCSMEFGSENDKERSHKYCVKRHREVELREYLNTLSDLVKQRVLGKIAGEAKKKGVCITYR